jgi:hypothetical protein
MVVFGIVTLTILLNRFLSEGGGGWIKTFRVFFIKILVPVENLDLHLCLTSKDTLRAFCKKISLRI